MSSAKPGIDFHKALAILSDRSSQKTEEHKDESSGGCSCHAPAGDLTSQMGQVIDLQGSSAGTAENSEVAKRKVERKQDLQDRIRRLSTRQLLQAVLEAQQQRVAAYRDYDRGLEAILATNNVSYYPTVCTEATAAFSVVSDTLQMMQSELEKRGGQEYLALIRHLQKHEQSKLQHTAALHLEQIRLSQVDEEDASTRKLLQESTGTLKATLAGYVDEINEALEEILCAVVDAPQDDGTSE